MKNYLLTIIFYLLVQLVCFSQVTSVYFDTDKSNLTALAHSTLDSLITSGFINQPAMNIECHCDNRADSSYNYHLSMRRAQSVYRYFKSKGIETSFTLIGHGEQSPSFSNSSPDRSKNRRCDIYVQNAANQNGNIEDVAIADWKVGSLLQIGGLEFVGNQAVPNYYSMPKLYALLDIVESHPKLSIQLRGHVCCGDDLPLSIARAKAVRDFLVENGVDSNRLSFAGFSNSEPLVEEVDEETQQRNRRVEVLVKSKPGKEITIDSEQRPNFSVKLREVPFKPRTPAFAHPAEFNLGLLADMIDNSNGYNYELSVYAANKNLQNKRFRTVYAFFKRQKINVKKLKIKPGKNQAYQNEDILILEVKPIGE